MIDFMVRGLRLWYNVGMIWVKERLKPVGAVGGVVLVVVTLCAFTLTSVARASQYAISRDEVVDFTPVNQENEQVGYLTDGEFLASSKTAYGKILKDITANNTKIALNYDGTTLTFERGVWAHATSNVDFDLRPYHGEYDYLLVYVGLNKTANASGNVKFTAYTSDADSITSGGNVWQVLPELNGEVMTVSSGAKFLKIDIRNINYIRFYADSNGANSNDHAVYGDLKLVKEGYGANDGLLPTVEQLDEKIRDKFGGLDLDNLAKNPDYQANVLRRTLVERMSRTAIMEFLHKSAANCEVFNWLYNDLEVLGLYINGGKLSTLGNYGRSLEVLAELYNTYKADLNDGTPLQTTQGTRGDLYLRMMVTLSLTHAEHIRLWVRDRVLTADGQMVTGEDPNSANVSRPVDRYKVYKRMYLSGKLNTQIFEQLEVEEMRYVMAALTGDDETEWMHDYLAYNNRSPYSWPAMPYANAGYWHLEDYADENQVSLTEKYRLDGRALGVGDYKITNDKYQPHLWMILKWGGVCWQISNTGQNMMSSFGIPSTTLGQRPDHVAYANYSLQDNGDAYWALTNNVYGWTTTDFVGYDGLYSYRYSNAPMRHMNDWGFFYDKRGYAYKYNGTYLLLAQAAINDYSNYLKAHELTLLAESYAGDLDKQEEIYNQALEVQEINLDAWLGLIQVYKTRYAGNNGGGADQAYLELAKRVMEAYRLYPVPMYDMLRWFAAEIESPAVQAAVLVMQTRTLEAATKLTANDTVQYSAQVLMAKHLLGVIDKEVASFSFDGDEAGKIKLNQRFEGAAWDYSLDGGQTWSSGEHRDHWINENEYKLSADEIERITAENDIMIHLSGVSWSEENYYTINIIKQVLPTTLYANDWENRVVGVNEKMEWRLDENDAWTSYRDSSPQRIGDVTVEVRVGRTGTGLASDSGKFTFTTDTDTPERKYLPISHIEVDAFSSEALGAGKNGNAAYAIDGNINTRWHSAWDGSDQQKYITFAFDHDVYLTGMDYKPTDGANGRILNGRIEGSVDGENWQEIGEVTWADSAEWKSCDFEVGDEATRFVRVTGEVTHGNFISAAMFNFYEDSTQSGHPSAAIGYSTTEVTAGDVVARFIKPTDDTVITNNGGSDTYVFTSNGTFIFEFETNGVKAQAVAKVDWIDKEAPVGRVEFYCAGTGQRESCAKGNGKTNHAVEAKLIITNEKDAVEVLNNGGSGSKDESRIRSIDDQQERDPLVFTFLRNGTFTFLVKDKAGNVGRIEVLVDWIDMAAPKTKVIYSTRESTTGEVVARLVKVMPDSAARPGVSQDDDRNEDEYFKPLNKGLYDSNGLEYNEDFVVTNNGGSAEYVFRKNGEFVFQHRDEAGNVAATLARVDWIKDSAGRPDDGSNTLPGNSEDGGTNDGNMVGNNSAENRVDYGGGDVSAVVGLPEGVKAENSKLPLTEALLNKFGEQSEYFRLSFVSEDGGVANAAPESITLTINKDKKLKGIYLVKEDGTTEKVQYEMVDGTHVLIKNPRAGNYLFEYEEKEKGRDDTSKDKSESDNGVDVGADDEKGEERSTNNGGVKWWWPAVGGVVILGILVGSRMAENRRR